MTTEEFQRLKKEVFSNLLPLEKAKKLETNNLLRYYRSKYVRVNGSGMYISDRDAWIEDNDLHEIGQTYLTALRNELNRREHIDKTSIRNRHIQKNKHGQKDKRNKTYSI